MSINSVSKAVISIFLLASNIFFVPAYANEDLDDSDRDDDQKIVVWSEIKVLKDTDKSNPVSVLTKEDMASINATTTEDLVTNESSLVIRKRFIGDSNGTIGMRGSNMFQTTRSMVFADGVPLHYLLQTRWSGAPRWTLVSADEIAQIEVIYGPYSAEYSGNAMGGVIEIETAIPTERRFHVEGSLFNQQYQQFGFDDDLSGYKGFLSYSDKIDNFTIYASYNRLENDGHPQSFRFGRPDTPQAGDTEVTGAMIGNNEYGDSVFYFADNGIAKVRTNNYKVKLGYETENWFALLNIAYEDRDTKNDFANNYLVSSATGEPVWNGRVVQDGVAFSVRERNFAGNDSERDSLLVGFRLQGELNENWWMEANISSFDILEDKRLSSNANPRSPAYTDTKSIREYGDTGWSTAEIKLQNDSFFDNKDLSFVTGLRYENYQLDIKDTSGGDTAISAAYAQVNWQMNPTWDLVVGVRQESWKSKNGYFGDQQHIDRSESRTSPKLSLGYQSPQQWQVRYSVAKAFRFPIVEELFQNERRTQGTSIANANLEPEDGFHQNLMFQQDMDNGYWRINYFTEQIDDVIFAQTTIVDNRSIRTFIPIDTVDTDGIEFAFNRFDLLDEKLDVRFNLAYIDSTIKRNSANPSLEGKVFPRMPEWRSNLLLTYHLTESLDIGGSIRYASNSFGDLDNADTERGVYGGQDGYTFFNIKSNYQLNENTTLSFGVDNITDEVAFVHHPWPQRTIYVEAALDF